MQTYYDKIQEQKRSEGRSKLDKRIQQDTDLLYLKKYVLSDDKGRAVPDIVNVTLNRPAVFGANVVSAIGNAKQQVVVESDSKKIDTHEIETFLDTAFQAANRRLWKKSLPTLNPFADIDLCFAGRTARRIWFRMKDGILIPDISNWSGRYVYSAPSEDGLEWAAYETLRLKEDIEAEYGILIGKQEGVVIDVLDKKVEEVWIEGKKVKEEAHGYGFCPVVLQSVSLGYGPVLLGKGWQEHEGESIFFMIRDIVPELNRLISILQTLNLKAVKAPMKYKSKDGHTAEPPEYEEATASGAITSLDAEGDITPIDYGDAKRAAEMVYRLMEKAFQEGSYTDIDIGNVQQPFSAVALVTIGENKDMVYMPRLAAKELLNVATAEMIIKQVEQIGGTVEVGIPGHKKTFSTAKLMGEYSIDYKYFVKSPKIDIARMSVAEAAAKWYPREFIYSDVLQVEDVDGMMRDWSRQEAALISPGVMKHRIIVDLLKQAEDNDDEEAAREAQIMALELGMSLDQIRTGQTAPEKPVTPIVPAEAQAAKPTLPLLGTGGQVGGLSPNKVANSLQKTPERTVAS